MTVADTTAPDSCLPRYKSAPGDGATPPPPGTGVFDGGFLSPVLVCKQAAVEHNVAALAGFCRDHAVLFAPHAKTTMAPQLVARQLAAGAWGMSAATVGQVRMLRAFGVATVLLANELVDPAGIRWVADELLRDAEFRFLTYVDSRAGADLLNDALAPCAGDVVIDVLLEVGAAGGRTGARSLGECTELAAFVDSCPRLRLVGVAGYEGCLGSDRKPDTVARVAAYCGDVAHVAAAIGEAGLFAEQPAIVSVGGGVYFDVVVAELGTLQLPNGAAQLIIRSGSYITHDDGLYAHIAAFSQPDAGYTLQPALEIWGRVLSRPEPELAFLDFGRRDVPFDQGLPTPRAVRRVDGSAPRPVTDFTVTALNDQHAYLRVPEDDSLTPGQWVGAGISHPCTTFDKWRYIPLVDEQYRCVDTITPQF